MTEWFSSWFDSSYYHQLYGNRDYDEADQFIQLLFEYLDIPENSRVLDLACGKGRHALSISKLGHQVTGIDLSANSIKEATKFSDTNLDFEVHDMRLPFQQSKFDLVVNLFTSFGYFENKSDNYSVIANIKRNLKENGELVLDYLNPSYVKESLIEEEEKIIGNTRFEIRRHINDNTVIKDIKFHIGNKRFQFQEKVSLFEYKDFKEFFNSQSMSIINYYGDYQLNPKTELSPRQIFHVK